MLAYRVFMQLLLNGILRVKSMHNV